MSDVVANAFKKWLERDGFFKAPEVRVEAAYYSGYAAGAGAAHDELERLSMRLKDKDALIKRLRDED